MSKVNIMNEVINFQAMQTIPRCVADVLTSEVIIECVETAVEGFGLEAFSLAYTSFGEHESAQAKLAA
jgi:hypothetical protein